MSGGERSSLLDKLLFNVPPAGGPRALGLAL